MYIFRLKIHTHRRYVKKPSAETQVSTGANEKRFINKTYIYRFLKQRSFASLRGTHSKTGKNTMKPLIRILSLWLAALCFGACTDDDLIDGTPTPEPETGIVIRLSAGDLEQTRTELTSQANLHHVQSVYAILYKENADKTDYDYVTCDDLNWSPKDSSSYGEAQAQAKVLDLPNDINLEAGNYTVLCVGLDGKDDTEISSRTTYDLPTSIQNKPLSQAKAILAQGKGKEDIAKSELFAGWNQFHFAPDSLNIVEVEMKRRVAGVLCYLTDIPYELTISGENAGTYRVTKIQVCLYKNQNSEISLLRKEIEGKEYPDDFGLNELDDSNVLMEFPLENQGYSKQQDKNLYAIPQKEGLAPNSLLGGVYMLPIDKDEQENTIEVKLLGKKINSSGENPAEGAEEIEIANFPAINDDIDFEATEGSTKNYPIRPNLIYHIGDKPSDEEEGTPESLAGTEVKIGVKCWENENVDVEFPNVPIELGMQITDVTTPNMVSPFTMLAEGEDSETTPHYIFDCIGSSSLYLIVTPSVQYNKWKVNVTRIDSEGSPITGDDNMIYLKQTWSDDPNVYNYYGTEYPKTYDKEGPIVIPIALTDYAEVNGSSIRRAKITLVGLDEDGNPDNSTTKTMIVEQYNAILVNVGDDENTSYRGFSHFNWHSTRDRLTGEVEKNEEGCSGEKLQWGYFNKDNGRGPLCSYIYYGYHSELKQPDEIRGNINYLNAGNAGEDDYKDYWYGSAIYRCAQKGCIITSEVDYKGKYVLKEDEAKWYLPAKKELKSFLENEEQSNINLNNFYWSSCAVYTTYRYVWAYSIDAYGNIKPEQDAVADLQYTDYNLNLARNKYFYARQCCNIPSESK